MASIMAWSTMQKYRKDYNQRYLKIMRNSGYDIKFKLEYNPGSPHAFRWKVCAYVNGRHAGNYAVYGFGSKERPNNAAIRRTYYRLLNQLLGMNLREDNSNEQTKTNQQRTPTNRTNGVRVVEERSIGRRILRACKQQVSACVPSKR